MLTQQQIEQQLKELDAYISGYKTALLWAHAQLTEEKKTDKDQTVSCASAKTN